MQEKRTPTANAPLSRRVGTLGVFFLLFHEISALNLALRARFWAEISKPSCTNLEISGLRPEIS